MQLKSFLYQARPAWLALPVLLALSPLPGHADDLRDQQRQIFNRNKQAVVTIQVTLKSSSDGRSREGRQEITGTVVDASGLIVAALSSCDPAELYRRLSDEYKIETEVSDIKILLEDSSDIPAEIVLRDRDLDLAFIRPKTKPANPMPSVNLTDATTVQVLDEVVALNRLNRAASRAYAAYLERICAVAQKPRMFYVPESTTTGTTPGCPAFASNGKFVGIFVVRVLNAGGSSNTRQNITAILLPAEDILKAARQAPEIKPEASKKQEPAAAPGSAADSK